MLIDHVDGVTRVRTATTRVYVSVEDLGDDDDAVWAKLLTPPSEHSGSPTSRGILERVGGMDEGVKISRVNIFDTSTDV
jgi:hypothetical protein